MKRIYDLTTGKVNTMIFAGGRQGDLDNGTWCAQGDLSGAAFAGGRQGDLDSGTWC